MFGILARSLLVVVETSLMGVFSNLALFTRPHTAKFAVACGIRYPLNLMYVVGSIIARLGSKRLIYKNLMPLEGKPLVGLGIEKLRQAQRVDEIVVSTKSELIARVALDFGASVLLRPPELASDEVPSIPVSRHLVEHHPCDVHVNFNVNFPICQPGVIGRAVELALENGEALSNPYAAWAQTRECLENYGDIRKISAHEHEFEDDRPGRIDIHTLEDLLETYRRKQGDWPEGLPDFARAESVQEEGLFSR